MPDSSLHGIFLSYRREDATPYARLLKSELTVRFPDAPVFMDLDSIEPGLDFVEVIERAVSSCAVLVVLMGRQWATLTDEGGQRRLDDPDDFVRSEVQAALERGVRVIPVLVDGARPVRRRELPDELQKLARLNALELSAGRYPYDADRLFGVIQQVLTEIREREEAEQKAREEAEQKAQEKAEQKAREEAEQKAQEKAEQKAREEAERKAREEAERKAQKVAVQLVDDLQGGPAQETLRFGIDGADYEINLNSRNAERFQQEISRYVDHARRARQQAKRTPTEEAERQAREEAERQAREEAERQAREEAERQAREEAEWRRDALKYMVRSKGMARKYTCRDCGREVSGQNLIRHFDKVHPNGSFRAS
jgi:hypothetical protein